MVTTDAEEATLADVLEACAHMWPAWVKTARHSGKRAELVVKYDRRLDQLLSLSR